MKRFVFSKITLLVLSSVVITMAVVACKKDKLTEPPATKIQEPSYYDSKTSHLIQRIKTFENQMNEVRYGTIKSDSYMEIDDAIWNIESLFNTTYSFPEKCYVEKKVQELSFQIETSGDKLLLRDINSLYEEIVESVREAYRSDGFVTDKGLMSIFVEKGETRSGKLDVKVVVVSGRSADYQDDITPILYGPFSSDACWYFGEYGGSCDDPTIVMDAAELLEDTINYFHGYRSENRYGYRSIYVNLLSVYLKGNEYKNKSGDDYYLFYKEDCEMEDLFLDVNKMNSYYYAEVDVIKNIVPNDPKYSSSMPEDWVFMEVNIDGVSGYENYKQNYAHNNYIFYGSKYSVKNDEFGMQKDLLHD